MAGGACQRKAGGTARGMARWRGHGEPSGVKLTQPCWKPVRLPGVSSSNVRLLGLEEGTMRFAECFGGGTVAATCTPPPAFSPLAPRSPLGPTVPKSFPPWFSTKQREAGPQPPGRGLCPRTRAREDRRGARMSTHPVAVERRALLKYILQVHSGSRACSRHACSCVSSAGTIQAITCTHHQPARCCRRRRR